MYKLMINMGTIFGLLSYIYKYCFFRKFFYLKKKKESTT